MQRYELFRVETMQGDETFIVAEDEQRVSEIFSSTLALKDGEQVLYRIFPADDELTEEQRTAIETFLEHGPIGIATYHDGCGWSVVPPG